MTAQNVITGSARATKGASGAHPSARHKIGAPVKKTAYNDHRVQMGGTVGAKSRNAANPSTSSKEDIIIQWNHNVLTTKQSWTYNLRLTMLSSKDNLKMGHTSAQTLNSENGIVVAETGITSKFNITQLETNHIVNWTPLGRAAFGLSATMTITEPLGVTLLDNIVRGAKNLGIQNHINAVYLLEIRFEDSSHDIEEDIPYLFSYVMVITDFTVAVDQGGARYYLKLVELPQVALRSDVQDLTGAITIEANTLGEFVVELTKKVNELSEREIGKSAKFPDIYDIILDETSYKMSGWVFTGAKQLVTSGAPKHKMDLPYGNTLVSEFFKGTSIVEVLSIAVGATKEMQELPLAGGNKAKASGEDDEGKGKGAEPNLWYRIVPDATYTNNFDTQRKTNQRKFTYKVKLEINEKAGDTSNKFYTDFDGQNARLRHFVGEKLLAKKYLYMYTGQNTEVLSFDIKLDQTYWVMKASDGGVHSNPDTILSQAPIAEKSKLSDTSSPGTKYGSSNQETAQKPDASAPPSNQGNPHSQDNLNSAMTPTQEGSFKSVPKTNKRIKHTYLESFSTEEEEGEDNWLSPMRIASDIPKDTKQGMTSVAGPSSMKFGAVYADMVGGDFMDIELNIVGDPYWLGMPNINKQYQNISKTIAAAYDSGTNLFYFKLLMPQEHDETGDTVISDSFSISGLYSVRSVVSSFIDGGFTQHLYAHRSLRSNMNLLKPILDKTEEEPKKKEKEKEGKESTFSASDNLNKKSTVGSAPPPLDRGVG
jgi:hypothetical protein